MEYIDEVIILLTFVVVLMYRDKVVGVFKVMFKASKVKSNRKNYYPIDEEEMR